MANHYIYTVTRPMSDISDDIGLPLAAWDEQQGGAVFNVIYDGDVYTNKYWVERWHIPGAEGKDASATNAWEYVRAASADEISRLGNPKEKIVAPTEEAPYAVLKNDALSEQTWKEEGFTPNGEGSNLSYTATRVCNPMYNRYDSDSSRPRLSAYITEWSQYDVRLGGDEGSAEESKEYGRGFNLETLMQNPTAYDRIIFSFLGICGDIGVKKDRIDEVWQGWNTQVDTPIGPGHVVILDPYGALGTARNVGLPDESANTEVATSNFLRFYSQAKASGLLGGLRELKKIARNAGHRLELAFSIGGWSLSSYFSEMASKPEERAEFVASVVDFFERFPMFDGVDIDWEYPGGGGEEGNISSPDDGSNYALLTGELRAALDRRFGNANRKSISIACSSTIDKLKLSNIPGLLESGLDNIYLMSYDFFGTGWATEIGHHTDLNSADEAIRYLHNELDVPYGKIHLGYAGYGRAAVGADLGTLKYTTAGSALGTMENGAPEFYDVVNNYLDVEHQLAAGKNGFVLMTDTSADADFLFSKNKGHFISLDTPRTVKLKGDYAQRYQLGGIFAWSADQDCGLLANAAREGMGYIASSNSETIDMGPLYNPGEAASLKTR